MFSLTLSLGVISSYAQVPLGEVYSSDATVKGAVALSAASTRLMSGSSVTAGSSNASVRLLRGGELRVCQGSSVSLTSSANGSQLMVGISTGTIEAHYPLANSRDSVMTPDFQISLNGPAVFHLAISTDEGGNTCVQSLHGNTGSVTVSELMGDASYTVMPGDQVIFRAGHARDPGPVVANCGCPAEIPAQRAAVEDQPKPAPAPTPAPAPAPAVTTLIASAPKSMTAPPPAVPPGGVHVQVEAPFVFRASEPRPPRDAPADLAEIHISTLPVLGSVYGQPPPQEVAQTATQETEKAKKKKRHGVWGFLSSIFKG
ncbi:MAG: hypothetical protein WB347_16010 [Terriglobales bacterium]